MRRRSLLAALASCVAALVLPACAAAGRPLVRNERTGAIDWTPCGKIECGTLSVPLDYAHPRGRRITLALGRLPAAHQSIGALFVNPGGPGGSGVDLVRDAAAEFPAEILASFDVVSWDPRGLAGTPAVRCLGDLDPFYAVNRDSTGPAQVAENVAVSRAFVESCRKYSAPLLPYMSTAASVRDLDSIRAAIGVPKISYLGFSYGTLIGAMYADTFPQHVRAMVLDGAVDPARSYAETTIEQAQGFDDDLEAFFDHCRSDAKCAFARGGDPAAAYDDLARTIAAEPVPATVDGEPRTLGPGEFAIGVASALYAGPDGYDTLAAALAQAGSGIGSKLLALSDDYTGRTRGANYSNETAAFYATSCIDGPSPTSVAAVRALADRAARAAPYFGASNVWLGLPCTFWPAPVVGEVAPIRAPHAPPLVVVGTTKDPATPYPWAESLAAEMRSARLLTLEGTGHTAYGRNDCIDANVDGYLLRLVMPAEGTTCG
ncbi:MAG TPA: alpha/beta hydrolase [Acidimicrobiia bacterium]|nr:alpha/beta hydrolase [Acidimicrobiia bacterium]